MLDFSELTDLASESQLINLWTQTLDLPPEIDAGWAILHRFPGGGPMLDFSELTDLASESQLINLWTQTKIY